MTKQLNITWREKDASSPNGKITVVEKAGKGLSKYYLKKYKIKNNRHLLKVQKDSRIKIAISKCSCCERTKLDGYNIYFLKGEYCTTCSGDWDLRKSACIDNAIKNCLVTGRPISGNHIKIKEFFKDKQAIKAGKKRKKLEERQKKKEQKLIQKRLKGGFPDIETYQKAKKIHVYNYKQYQQILLNKNTFPNQKTYALARKFGVETYENFLEAVRAEEIILPVNF